MGGLRNPASGGKTFHVFVETPEGQARIRELESIVEEMRRRPPEVREVVREVVKEDHSLLAKYNSAMKELGALKRDAAARQNATAQVVREDAPQIATVVHLKRVIHKKAIAAAAAAGIVAGAIAGAKFGPRDIPSDAKVERAVGGSRGPSIQSAPSGGVPKGSVK